MTTPNDNPLSAASSVDAISNPYATTSQPLGPDDVPQLSDVEAFRMHYLRHEASVRSIGMLYYLGGSILLLASLAMLVSFAQAQPFDATEKAVVMGMSIAYFAMAIMQIFTAYGLRRLRPYARVLTILIGLLGLIAIPIGTIISAYILYLVLCEKGRVVFSPGYQDVIAKTPDIKYRGSLIVIAMVGLVISLVIISILVGVIV